MTTPAPLRRFLVRTRYGETEIHAETAFDAACEECAAREAVFTEDGRNVYTFPAELHLTVRELGAPILHYRCAVVTVDGRFALALPELVTDPADKITAHLACLPPDAEPDRSPAFDRVATTPYRAPTPTGPCCATCIRYDAAASWCRHHTQAVRSVDFCDAHS